jgi:DNA-binding NarL/FixJ family response regulator
MLTAAHIFKIQDTLKDKYLLRPREVAVLAASMEASSFKDSAIRCNITAKTVRVHMHRCYRKLGVANKFACYKKLIELFEICT